MRQKPLQLTEWTSDMGPEMEAAGIKLGSAIGADKVRAWGRPGPHSPAQLIPSDHFRISGLKMIVGAHGDLQTSPRYKMFEYEGQNWSGMEFEPAEIRRVFAKPPTEIAIEWMRRQAEGHAANGDIGVRENMVRLCMKQTGCTKREAEAAHKLLPDNMKRPRGRAPRTIG